MSIFCILFISSAVWAQPSAGKAASCLSKTFLESITEHQMAKQTFQRGMFVRAPYLASPVVLLIDPQQIIGIAGAEPVRAVKSTKPKKRNYESPLLPFLKEEWELPPAPPRVPAAYQDKVPLRYVGRSLESLRAECKARGILPWDWETYSRQELAYFLFTYESLKESAKIPSRLDAPETDVKKWAHQQPDFIASNYLSFGEEYEEPFTGPTTNVRMLVVNDVWEEVSALSLATWQDGHATFTYAADVDEAINKLTLQPDAYDIVLIDHDLDGNKKGPSLSMWMYDQHVSIPAILYSRVDIGAEWAYKYNFKGRLEADTEPQAVLNFVRNILTTGKAYPAR